MKRIAIVGGGITGLTAAFYAKKLAKEKGVPVEVTLFEADSRLGGKVHTEKRDGCVIERGADSFLARKKPGMQLLSDLGLEEKVYHNETGQSYVLVKNKLHKIPAGTFMGIPIEEAPFLASEILSEKGKKRALDEINIAKGPKKDDQSLGLFLRRRFGDELVDYLLAPLLSGIYSSNIDDMSLMASFPNFYEMEQKYGSVLRGLRTQFKGNKAGTGRKKGQFVSLQGGLTTMIEALEKELSSIIQKETKIQHIQKEESSYLLTDHSGKKYEADSIIITIPYHLVPQLFEASASGSWGASTRIPVTSVGNVALAFHKKDMAQTLDGTGFVVSETSDVRITACTWTHLKWSGTTPEDMALLRAYVGRPKDQAIVAYDDQKMTEIVLEDLKKIMNLHVRPQLSIVTRWQEMMPQYVVGHDEKVTQMKQALAAEFPHVHLAGASYDGVGLPDCIAQAREAAENVLGK